MQEIRHWWGHIIRFIKQNKKELNKQALTTSGSPAGENVRAYTAGGNFHIDWTPDNALYILFETGGMIYFSNHMNELNWNTPFHLGLEYSLKF